MILKHAKSFARSWRGKSMLGTGAIAGLRKAAKYVSKAGKKSKRGGGKVSKIRKRWRGHDSIEEIRGSTAHEKHVIVANPKPPKGVQKRGGTMKFFWNTVNTAKLANTGIQGYDMLLALGSRSQWMVSSGVTNSYYQSPVRWFDMNPNQKTTGNSNLNLLDPQNDRMALKEVEVRLGLTNLSNVSSIVNLYVVKCIKECNESPISVWGHGYDTTDYVTPTGNGRTSLGAVSPFVIGATPYDNSEFGIYWKILKVIRVDLSGANSSKELTLRVVLNQLAREEALNNSDLTFNFPKGSVCMFYTAYGQVVEYVDGPAFQADRGQCEFAAVMNCKAIFKPVKYNGGRLQVNEAFVSSSAYSNDKLKQKLAGFADDVVNFEAVI